MKRIALLAGLLLVALPTASAATTVSVEEGDIEIMPGGSASIPVTVTVTCDQFITSGSQSLTYSISSNARADLQASSPDITLEAGAGCVPGNSVSGTADVTLSPGPDAFGLVPQTLTIYAVNGDENVSFQRGGNVWVAYDPGHSLSTDISFPYSWTGGEQLEFNLTLDVTANSDTMVMFFPVSSSANGSVGGLSHQRFFFTQNEEPTRVLPITWTPPTGDWDNATISFSHYSHCLLGGEIDPCAPQLEENVTWTIMNDAPKTQGESNGQDSPGLGVGLLIGLVAVALVLRRR